MKLRVGDVFGRKAKEAHHTSMTKPTDPEISFFESRLKEIAGKHEPRILIIGCSPEIRELAAKLKIKTTVVANDLEVIERTTKLMKRRNNKEEWLEGSITELPLKKESFDAIFGDHILSNVSPFNREVFYERMKEILKKDGFVVMRSVVFKKTARPFENRIKKYFSIDKKEFVKEGIFSDYFPIYLMRPVTS